MGCGFQGDSQPFLVLRGIKSSPLLVYATMVLIFSLNTCDVFEGVRMTGLDKLGRLGNLRSEIWEIPNMAIVLVL